jgi:WS/DGAT/MGAT family acyltransferase
MRQLSGSDAFFLYSDKAGKHQHVSTIYLYDPSTAANGQVDFQTILEHVRERLGTSRIFRQRLVNVPLNLDYPYWIHDAHFDLEFHVRHIALPHPGDWRQFCIMASRLHARPVDLRRPVWEMYVIEGLDNVSFLPRGAFAVLVKVHHVAIDDVTEDDFTVALHDLVAAPEPEEAKRRWFSEKQPGSTQLLGLAWFNNTVKLLETGQALLDKLPFVGSNPTRPEEVLHFDDAPAPRTRFNRNISPHRVWDACFFDLADLEAIAAAVPGAGVTEAVLAICSGALRGYLEEKHELPEQSLYALVPAHVRKSGDAEVPGHRVQLIRVRLTTDRTDPLNRLAAIREEVTEAGALRPISGSEMSELQDVLPATAMTLAARTIAARVGPGKHFRENHNTVVSILPGPAQPLYLCGARLKAYTGMAAIMDNLALSHMVTTYDGTVAIAPVCDRKIMPDPGFYSECLNAAFTELKDAAAQALARPGKTGS